MLDRLGLQLGISLGPETPVRDASGITFAVDDVVPASQPLQLSTLGVGQRAADNALFPLISWAVTSPEEADA